MTRRIVLVLAALVVVLVGVRWYASKSGWLDEPFAASMSPGAVVPVADYKLSGPYAHENLTIFLVHAPETLGSISFLTLQEALEQKKAVVHETGQVNQLTVENLSDEELFIQSGDIVKGGKQDRTLPYDSVIGAKSGKVDIDSFCVEHGRWKKRGEESSSYFSSSSSNIGTSDMKRAANSSQAEVWNNVSQTQERLSKKAGASAKSEASESSLQLTLESPAVRSAVAPYLRALESKPDTHGDVVGCVVVVNGKVKLADVYASRALFRKLWPKLLEGAAVEAFIESEPGRAGGPISEATVRAFLTAAEGGVPVNEAVTQRTYVQVRQSTEALLFESCDRARENLVLHRSVLAR